jgi:beta-carotene hydroxylase
MRYLIDFYSLLCLFLISVGKIFIFVHVDSLVFAAFFISLTGSMFTMLIKHNHCHLTIFRSAPLNYIMDYWLNVLTGTSTSSVKIVHNINHHDAVNDENIDWVSTKRFEKRGNHVGCILYVLTAPYLTVIKKSEWLSKNKNRRIFKYNLLENIMLIITVILLGLISFKAVLIVIILPAMALQFVLALVNYLQHFDTKDRNSNDIYWKWFNFLFFNVGYHNRHHDYPSLHWSLLSKDTK